jgi:hypothetical protein
MPGDNAVRFWAATHRPDQPLPERSGSEAELDLVTVRHDAYEYSLPHVLMYSEIGQKAEEFKMLSS